MPPLSALGSTRYRMFRAVVRVWLHSTLDLTVEGLAGVPRQGPALIVCNHPSAIDGVLLLSILPRRISSVLTADDMPLPWLRRRDEVLGFPLVPRAASEEESRRRHFAAARIAGERLRRGWLFGVPPEGDVNPTRRLGTFASTFVYLAWRASAPIVPVAIVGAEQALRDPARPGTLGQLLVRRTRVHVAFLPTIRLEGAPSRRDADDLAGRVRGLIQATVDRAPVREAGRG